MDRAEIERRLRQYFETHSTELTAVYLFGSVARAEAGPGSDVDVAILKGGGPPRTFDELPLDLEADLEAHLGLPVQVVVLDGVSPEMAHYVRRDGVLIVDRDPSLRIQWEVRSRNEYFDVQPILREYRKLPRETR